MAWQTYNITLYADYVMLIFMYDAVYLIRSFLLEMATFCVASRLFFKL